MCLPQEGSAALTWTGGRRGAEVGSTHVFDVGHLKDRLEASVAGGLRVSSDTCLTLRHL